MEVFFMEYLDLITKRRSSYVLEHNSVVDDKTLINNLTKVILEAPTAFNSMATHIVIALNDNHYFVWDTIKSSLKKILPNEVFKKTELKLNVFKEAYGTILIYKDIDRINELKKDYPKFANRQDDWGEQNIGILVYGLWLELVNLGYGCNMQHYDPLPDKEIAKRFNLPDTWKLEAEMVFGKEKSKPGNKDYLPKEDR